MIQPVPVAALSDNYIWLLPLPGKNSPRAAIIVDPGDARPVLAELRARSLDPAAILVTHHHPDHTGGIRELAARFRIPVYGPTAGPAPGIDHPLRDGGHIAFPGGVEFRILEVPGHTLDHIAYCGAGLLLCGDTLFAGGCGRLFEGTPAQMLHSLRKLAALPRELLVCCGHEYTLANLEFARVVEPDNAILAARIEEVRRLRAQGRPSLPSTIGTELDTNPFLRCTEPAVIAAAAARAGRSPADETATFTVIRRWKDEFRPPPA